ncbi:calcium-activated potassium channel subunit beta-2 [Triplophysa rosa]|uniref:Calcium-activated potassium channel beta 2 subunit n=1 Tax=Triplophysa rosa TaxID=992332 RepID=A0A9W7WVB5_TRIRA|nr:calcium-activated potassium channel subunit beta-2 [Triplophysa rosa]KAI7809295.1 calcium-activated potassium channel beta 2 subunit [Triplophysa rosa]
MFIIKGTKTTVPLENRIISRRFWGHELKDKKGRETALKAGEDRAILLGLGMVFSSVMMYFVICITMVRAYTDSVLAEETTCTVLNSSLTRDINCWYSCGSDCLRSSKYPCLQVYVSLNTTSRVGLLSHNEEMLDIQCFYVPKCQKDHTALHSLIQNISEHFKMHQQVTCYHDSSEHQASILLNSLYSSSVLHSLFWPSCILSGGTLIILMVKLTQYLSIMCEQIDKVPK